MNIDQPSIRLVRVCLLLSMSAPVYSLYIYIYIYICLGTTGCTRSLDSIDGHQGIRDRETRQPFTLHFAPCRVGRRRSHHHCSLPGGGGGWGRARDLALSERGCHSGRPPGRGAGASPRLKWGFARHLPAEYNTSLLLPANHPSPCRPFASLPSTVPPWPRRPRRECSVPDTFRFFLLK